MLMHRAILAMPRLNANEDEARVAVLPLGADESFAEGDLLFTVETTKAANDVIAPCAGRVCRLLAAVDDLVPVGGPICEVELEQDVPVGELELTWIDRDADEALPVRTERHVSAKARQRAQELGVDIDEIRTANGEIRVRDVERLAASPSARRAKTTPSPAIRNRFGPADAVILGGAGHARTIMDALAGAGFRLVGAVDQAIPGGTRVLDELQVLGPEAMLAELRESGLRYAFIGVGGAVSNASRRKVFEKARSLGFELPPLVAKSAYLGRGSTLGAASYCLPGSSVGAAVTIGENCIVNQNAVICHDSQIGDDVHLAPNAVVAGHCHIGSGSTLGMCATLINGCRIGTDCLVHNNVSVTTDVADGAVLTLADALARMPTRLGT
ncbi:PglD-related sugar-binding protein [Altererythrobacter sp. B11]|uniref:PglD-related sugar-binding protein n=1 Tax=Altererythrobacter sp. B11 TaxID=2060312 RepID=UPI001E5EF13D|nr:biotin/lipoyl-containing protein [Altererythrobacter sp. B11]